MSPSTTDQLFQENRQLRDRLAEAEDAIRALRGGEVDAILVGTDREEVYTLDSADKPYRLLVDQMPLGAASCTVEGVLLHGNPRFMGLLGVSLEDLVGKSMLDFLTNESRSVFEALLREASAATPKADIAGVVTLRRGDGTVAPACLGVEISREGPLGACVVVTDLTERRHYAELQRTQQALREADRRKNEFVAILAHELRNPLGPIRNSARVLKLKRSGDPELSGPIDMIERQVEQLARLLDDLLDISRVSRGALEIRRDRMAFSEVVDISVSAYEEELRARKITLDLDLPASAVELMADRARLIQLLCNLIANASKYTPEGGRIRIAAAVDGDTLRLSVKDNGIGIPPDRLTDIFELFEQVDRSGDREGGLGIGLTLARQIAMLHGGDVEARSDGIGHGSEFIVTLPAVVPSLPAPAKISPPESAAPPRRVLIVDDNRDAVESLAILLEIAGHEVHRALGGDAALALAQRVRPEVVLLDLGMPNVGGYEVARRIRSETWGKETYLVAISGWGQADTRLRTQEAGFDAHLVKPVDPQVLDRLLSATNRRARPGASSAYDGSA